MWIWTNINHYILFLVQRQQFWHIIFWWGLTIIKDVQDSIFACDSSLINSFMNCIIDQCYICKSPIKFSTYTLPYVMSLLTIRLAYDLFHLFLFFLLNKKVKKAKLKLNFIINLAHDYKDRSLSKHLKRKDRTKLLFN